MPTLFTSRQQALYACSLALLMSTASVSAQTATSPVNQSSSTPTQVASDNQEPASQQEPRRRRIDIGQSTDHLLAMQRNSQSPYPRHIDGEQASRSYQRYLKSFEIAIPERFDTGMDLKKQ